MLKKEKKSIVISLGDDGAIVGCYVGTKLLKRLFVTSHLSSDFVDVTKQFHDATIYLLLDTIDQNYIFSSIPAVGKSSVKKIIKRKLENEFDPNDLNSCIFMGKEKDGVKNILRYLFVSVRNSNPFKDWVEAIANLNNRFGGVYLIPVESEEFITKLRAITHGDKKDEKPDEWEILVSYNRVGGFRQVVLKNSKLIFTRISQSASLQTPDAVGKSISQESANTLEYIRRIGFYDQSISIYVISSKESSNFIEIPGVKTKDIYHYSPFELSQKLHIEQSAQESDKFGDVVFATNFIGNKKKILRIATPSIARSEKLQVMLKMISVICIFLIAALSLASAYMFFSGYRKNAEMSDLNIRIQSKTRELEGLKSFEKEYGLNPDNLQDAVKFTRTYSSKDKRHEDILIKYKEADVYSKYLKSVDIQGDDKLAVILEAVFDTSTEKSYSDVLAKFEQYKVAVQDAFKGYKVEFNGLPNENDIKVDFEKNAEKGKAINVTVSISQAGPAIPGMPGENER